jgi:hypothetical protein
MRGIVDREKLLDFMRDVGVEARTESTIYLTGGASALLFGWRATTIDVDVKLEPDAGEILRAIPHLKERYGINIELAAPDDFIPPLPGWRDRSRWIDRFGSVTFRHYDFYSQALSKLERGHARDKSDVEAMVNAGVVEPEKLVEFYAAIEPELYRYPAINPPVFRRAVENFVRPATSG